MGRPSVPLSADMPPLVMGTATFNSQYNADPYALPTTELVHRALSSGVRAFDTSPYYGPAEELLGRALATDFVRSDFPRHTYRLLTKVGRIAASSFDYSPRWIRHSVQRSLRRLHTEYLDVVYCHDVEFVSPEEVLEAVRELRRIRDTEGTVRYVGISGYPVDVLCDLAELVLRETGEPLDIVQSYANFTLQNTRLLTQALPRLIAAGVDVVPNASVLGMGILRRGGVPIGSMGDFHPAPDGLRRAARSASEWADAQGEKLEVIAIRFALESWLHDGAKAGALGPPLARSPGVDPGFLSVAHVGTGERLGVSVMGVSNVDELNETLRVWRSIIDGLENQDDDEEEPQAAAVPTAQHAPAILTPSEGVITDRAWSKARRSRILTLAQGVQSILGPDWVDYSWPSPGTDFVNVLPAEHLAALEELESKAAGTQRDTETDTGKIDEPIVTPPLEATDRQVAMDTAPSSVVYD
ncbi:D-arabinose 1-dehydrogenase (NAD(P)(+)) ARA2 [Aspergillus clavatus NRRL 1]|uniref:L-galactose dehydrogenase (L-GalDH), putative n=1 Tax=Aspergillus clavatus (strain ATCC 1007 / CBS 513.65 / DSM 816 / NCTC 3887 / NRRL 1 / QM 1276 / 107) TaxID=344612 RepID=A1CDA1_ASPCL|nr:L-galactose dehydrogenase (L-GalDH), putative [Aspergillus clavatus NRRL 1]EAW11828.1 L-galactose dehydrogenase (L-GalDH), putative [Aspergillus clavatus NRRL 1]